MPAEWLSYNRIRCVTPPWDGITDDDPIHGGHQVTIFVTNDGLHYSAGFGGPDETIDGGPPLNVGRGATFTYFGAEGFRDAARFYPADSDNAATVAIAGGPLVTLNPMGKDTFSYHSKLMHSYSGVYDDRGQSSASHMNASAAAAAAAEATTAALSRLEALHHAMILSSVENTLETVWHGTRLLRMAKEQYDGDHITGRSTALKPGLRFFSP